MDRWRTDCSTNTLRRAFGQLVPELTIGHFFDRAGGAVI